MTRLSTAPGRVPGAVPSTLVGGLFGPPVAAAELRGTASAEQLHPLERAETIGFGPKRAADFTAGRLCARRALQTFGAGESALTIESDRRPHWPAGFVGSITHTGGFCAAAVAPSDTYASIGLDAEIIGRVTRDVWSIVFTPDEAAMLAKREPLARAVASTIIFAAKEAYYKCQFGMTGAWVDFLDVSLTLAPADETSGSFTVQPLGTAPQVLLMLPRTGVYRIEADLVVAGLLFERSVVSHAGARS